MNTPVNATPRTRLARNLRVRLVSPLVFQMGVLLENRLYSRIFGTFKETSNVALYYALQGQLREDLLNDQR